MQIEFVTIPQMLMMILFILGILALGANVIFYSRNIRENFFPSSLYNMGPMPPLVMTDTIVVMP